MSKMQEWLFVRPCMSVFRPPFRDKALMLRPSCYECSTTFTNIWASRLRTLGSIRSFRPGASNRGYYSYGARHLSQFVLRGRATASPKGNGYVCRDNFKKGPIISVQGRVRMFHRSLTFVGSLTVLIAIGSLLTVPVSGQSLLPAASVKEATYTAPRTPYGQPDLQGFWNHQTYTPLERPDTVTKEFYTLEEVVALEQARAQREAEQTTPGTTADVHYDNSQFLLDRSQTGLPGTCEPR